MAGAAARHKHRKGVLSQISKQLSIEIHNEGIWIAQIQEKKDDKKDNLKDPHTDSEKKAFLPWGIQARDFLHSIICGEIPGDLEKKGFDFGDTVASNGGHIRCVLTDLRTSDETASAQRVACIHEQSQVDVKVLEKKVSDLQAAAQNAGQMQARYEKQESEVTMQTRVALKDYQQKKANLHNFRTKFAKFLGPGMLVLLLCALNWISNI